MISTRRNSNQIIRKPLNSIKANRVRPDNHAEVIPLQERVQIINTEIDDIVLLLWISNKIVLEPGNVFRFMRIAPKKVDNLLMTIHLIRPQLNLKRPRYLFNILNIRNRRPDTSMAAKDSLLLILDDCRQRQIIKCIINLRKAAICIRNVLT